MQMEWECHLPARRHARHPWRLILHGGDHSTISGSTDPVDRTRAGWPLREGPCSRSPASVFRPSRRPAVRRNRCRAWRQRDRAAHRARVRNRQVPIVHRRAKRELDARAATGTIGCDEAGLLPCRVSVPCRRSVIGGPLRLGRRGRAGRPLRAEPGAAPGRGGAQRSRLDRSTQGLFGKAGTARCSSSVGVAPVCDIYDRHHTGLIVDPVDHPVGATAGAEPVIHWRKQPLANPVRIGKQGASDELVGRRGNSLRESFAQGAANGGRRPQLIGFFRRLAAH